MIKLFGSTFRETISTFKQPLQANDPVTVSREDRIKVIGRLVITFLLLILAIYCLATDNKEIGGTLLGAITGYWLK
jgi:hypothetical protein